MYKDLGDNIPEEKVIDKPIDLYPDSIFREIDDIQKPLGISLTPK